MTSRFSEGLKREKERREEARLAKKGGTSTSDEERKRGTDLDERVRIRCCRDRRMKRSGFEGHLSREEDEKGKQVSPGFAKRKRAESTRRRTKSTLTTPPRDPELERSGTLHPGT